MDREVGLARISDDAGNVVVTAFMPGTSALLIWHARAGLDEWQLAAGQRLEADLLSEAATSSNAAAIERHLLTNLPATAGQKRDKQFGRLMRSSGETRTPADPTIRKFEATYRIAAIKRLLHPDDWAVLHALIARDMGPDAIAKATGIHRHIVSDQLREALSALSAAYDTADRQARDAKRLEAGA